MILVLCLSVLVGVAMVIQSGLNKIISEREGLGVALHLSNFVVLVAGLVILTLLPYFIKSDFTQLLKMRFEPRNWAWWFFVPGFCGLLIVSVMPYAIYKIGAAKIFVAVIGAQVLASLFWDYFVEGTPLDVWRIVGAVLTCAGAVVLNLSR